MIIVLFSKWIGDQFNSALYDAHIGLKAYPYLEGKLPKWFPTFIVAKDVMSSPVKTLPVICSVKEVLHVLSDPDNMHHAFGR